MTLLRPSAPHSHPTPPPNPPGEVWDGEAGGVVLGGWSRSSNLKMNLSPSDSDRLRFLLKI